MMQTTMTPARAGARRGAAVRRQLAVLALLAMTASGLVALAPSASAEIVVRPSDGVLRVKGHGWGHGRGMSQWGAHGAASKGLSYTQILKFYYPGTAFGSQGNLSLTVRVTTDTDGITEVQAPIPGNNRTPSGTLRATAGGVTKDLPTDLGATRWRTSTSMDGTTATLQYLSSTAGNTTWKSYNPFGTGAIEAPLSFSSSSGHVRLLLGGSSPYYRDYIGSVSGVRYSGKHYSVVRTTMETYLRGVVPAEMPASWEAAAVRAQAVAARTYASNQRASSPSSRPYQTCDSTSCQVFHGYADYTTSGTLKTARTHPLSDAAISDTAGEILTYGGKAAFTEFSASNGGYSVKGDVPYLVAKADPYDGVYDNSAHYWTDSVSVSTIEQAHPSIGRLASLHVTRDGNGDWGGRPLTVQIVGDSGSVTISGSTFSSEAGFKHRWWALLTPQDVPPAPRLSGADRYETAAAVAAKFPAGVPVVYVASGESFPDALAGAARAGSLGGPVLLTDPRSVPAATATALKRLAPAKIVVLGGTTAVSNAVVTALKPYATTDGVSRVDGADRYETAAKVASSFPHGVDTVYVASGADFPDALAGASVAAAGSDPVLLTAKSTLPPATAAAIASLAPSKVVVLGGTGAVSSGVEAQLRAIVPDVTRVAGADRYQTASLVSALLPGASTAYVASGTTFPDALAGAALAGRQGAPVLLTAPTSLPGTTGAALTTMRPSAIWVLGGPKAVSNTVATKLGGYLVP
jgi:SpoIID/LytB domain protein